MAQVVLRSTIRPIAGVDGPYWVQTVNASPGAVNGTGTDSNITLGLASINAALDQAKTDQGALLTALTATFDQAIIETVAHTVA